MKRLYLPIILFLLVVLEGLSFDLLPNLFFRGQTLIVVHWVFVFLLYVVVFYDQDDTYYAILYGIIFGLLIDVVYTGVLGVYMFSYGFFIFTIQELKRVVHTNFYMIMILGIIGISATDIFIYIVYVMISIVEVPWTGYLLHRLLPTVLANLIFLIILYPFVAKRLKKWGYEQLTG